MTDQSTLEAQTFPDREVEAYMQGLLSDTVSLTNLLTKEGHTLEAQDLGSMRAVIRILCTHVHNAELEQKNVY